MTSYMSLKMLKKKMYQRNLNNFFMVWNKCSDRCDTVNAVHFITALAKANKCHYDTAWQLFMNFEDAGRITSYNDRYTFVK